ncbi:hypothetical protein RS795_004742 [Escherichia coli]
MGYVIWLFLKAGLVVLDASQNGNGGDYGYLAFAFFAGLNVDKFIGKIEDVGMTLFGIEKSLGGICPYISEPVHRCVIA